ncbi:MFS transporter [Antrihabitans spumae]|uniref:MFS transporter n=1 Tax=Antrihabitans spumae TaxID=3373370 RepID=A0ABW7JZM2_9NOCA
MTSLSSPDKTAVAAKAERISGRGWAILLVLCGAIFLEGIDISMVGVAVPSIRAELGMSTSALQWVVGAYVLGYGGFMLLGGRAADLLGRRRMFLLWLGVFIVFSGLGGFATEGWMLITARFVTGIAAAFMAPAGLSIITTRFPEGPARNRAVLVYAGTGAAGFTLGLVVGGVLTEIDWRWVFFAPVAMAAVILVAAIRLIPAEPRSLPRTLQSFDLAGAFTATSAMLLLVFAVVRAPDVSITSTVVAALASSIFFLVFVVVEQRVPEPLIRLGILRSGPLLRANVSAILFSGSFMGFQFILVLYLQELREWSPLQTGLAMLVSGGDAILAPTLTPVLVNRFGNVRVVLGGLLIGVVAYGLFVRVQVDWTYAAMLPTMVLIGVSFAMVYGPLTIAATDGIVENEQGLASALLYTSWQFGTALGLAVVTAVQVAALESSGSAEGLLESYRAALVVPVIAVLAAVVVTGFGLRRRVGEVTAP